MARPKFLSLLICLVVAASASQLALGRVEQPNTTGAPPNPPAPPTPPPTPEPAAGTYNPVVFVPGDGGSQLEAKLNKPSRVRYMCELQSDWYDVWLNLHLLTPLVVDCLIDNMRLEYNSTDGKSYNSPGVQIRPTRFGDVESVAYLDIMHVPKTDYFETIVARLEKANGLARNIDMVGAPFDFRLAPNELSDFFANLTQLIELTYVKNGYRPVTIICHSMGCLNTVHLLNNKTANWRQVFVKRLISLAAPWDGSFKAIDAMLNGDDLGIPLQSSQKLQALQITFPSLMFLFPREPSFPKNQTLVATPKINYTLENIDKLFEAVQMDDQAAIWRQTSQIAAQLQPPRVELWCLYGTTAVASSPSKLIYHSELTRGSTNYTLQYGTGDSTVNLDSLRACERFASLQSEPVHTHEFDGIDHIEILRSTIPAQFISDMILAGDLEGPRAA